MTANSWLDALAWLYVILCIVWLLQLWLTRHIYGLGWLLLGEEDRARRAYQLLLSPGVILHELSHWLMAKALFVPTGRFSLFEPEHLPTKGVTRLGYVEVHQTDIWRTSLIGLAPLAGGIGLITLLASALGLDTSGPLEASAFLSQLPASLWSAVRTPLAIPVLYLVFSISNAMLPSKEDRRPWLPALMVPLFALAVFYLWRVELPVPGTLGTTLLTAASRVIAVMMFTIVVDLVLAATVFLTENVVGRMVGKRVEYR